jgi:hypothetical protein
MANVDELVEFWRRIPLEAPYMHPLDAARLRELGIDLEYYGIFGGLLPQPWVGPIATASAYVLQLNPGFSDDEVEIEQTRVQTHKIHQTIAATRQIEARKLRASLS